MLARVAIAALALAVSVAVPEMASAYSTPSGLDPSQYSTICPPWPADAASGADSATTEGQLTAQELAGDCYRAEQLWSYQAGQLSTIDSSIANLDGDVKALAGGKTLGSLHGDLVQVDSDLVTLDGDVKTLNTSVQALPGGSGSTSPQRVVLSSADRRLEADIASSSHSDLWVIVGAVVGVFLAWVLFRMVLP